MMVRPGEHHFGSKEEQVLSDPIILEWLCPGWPRLQGKKASIFLSLTKTETSGGLFQSMHWLSMNCPPTIHFFHVLSQ